MTEAVSIRTALRPWFGWKIRLPVFEGPFELLLYLLERNELDITAVSLARVADQYMGYLRQAGRINLDALADFIAVAARLLALKSRYLLPSHEAPQRPESEQDDTSLVEQLRLYKLFRDKARFLAEREQAGLRSFVRVRPPVPLRVPLGPNPYTVEDLRESFLKLLGLGEQQEVSSVVAPLKVTVEEKIALIRRKLASEGKERFHFREFLSPHPTAQEVIAALMAVLELIKQGEVRVRQERLFGPIYVIPRTSYP